MSQHDTNTSRAGQPGLSKKFARWVRPFEAAKAAGVDRATVYRWVSAKLVRSEKTNVMRVYVPDVLRLAKR